MLLAKLNVTLFVIVANQGFQTKRNLLGKKKSLQPRPKPPQREKRQAPELVYHVCVKCQEFHSHQWSWSTWEDPYCRHSRGNVGWHFSHNIGTIHVVPYVSIGIKSGWRSLWKGYHVFAMPCHPMSNVCHRKANVAILGAVRCVCLRPSTYCHDCRQDPCQGKKVHHKISR